MGRGLPHLIAGYSATEDVLTRAVPLLTLVFLASVAGATTAEWSLLANALAVAGGFAVLVGAFALVNKARGRPPFRRPDDVEWPELLAFVLVPALLQVVNGQLVAAAVTAGALSGLLILVYYGTSYGLLPLTRWALGKTFAELRSVLGFVTRGLPLLLVFSTFLFINAEVWEVSADFSAPFLAATVALFAGLGTLFLVARLPEELERLGTFASRQEVADLIAGTPVAGRAALVDTPVPPPDLSRARRVNVYLVVVFSQGVQVLLVSLLVGLFFVLLGILVVRPETIENWTGGAGTELVGFVLWERPVTVTAELLQVSAFLAAFAALYFTVTVVTDDTYRREFFDALADEVRQAFAVWTVYRELERAGR